MTSLLLGSARIGNQGVTLSPPKEKTLRTMADPCHVFEVFITIKGQVTVVNRR